MWGTGEFPAQITSNAENVSIWWRHHGTNFICSSTFYFSSGIPRTSITCKILHSYSVGVPFISYIGIGISVCTSNTNIPGVTVGCRLIIYTCHNINCALVKQLLKWGHASLRWRHNGHDCVSNHQPRHCLLNRLFERRSKKHQSSASLAFVRGIHRGPVNSPHKWPATRKMFPFDDVIMIPTEIMNQSMP